MQIIFPIKDKLRLIQKNFQDRLYTIVNHTEKKYLALF